jgi:hypothetical protein
LALVRFRSGYAAEVRPPPGEKGISFEHAANIEDIILTLFDGAPRKPVADDFERSFEGHPYFAAEQSLWGSAIELCVLFIWWSSKHAASPVAREPRAALQLLPNITGTLERALLGKSEWGGIPRAILGRYLTWLGHFGKDWLFAHISLLFPDDSEMLRRAAWHGFEAAGCTPSIGAIPRLDQGHGCTRPP